MEISMPQKIWKSQFQIVENLKFTEMLFTIFVETEKHKYHCLVIHFIHFSLI